MAGAGMSNGGRILHHEVRYLPDPRSTILFVGYQATGSLGRKILEGAPEVQIFGETVPIKCKKVNIPGFSAHADQPHLLAWLSSAKQSLKKVFVVQGEDESSQALAGKIRDELAVEAEVPTWERLWSYRIKNIVILSLAKHPFRVGRKDSSRSSE